MILKVLTGRLEDQSSLRGGGEEDMSESLRGGGGDGRIEEGDGRSTFHPLCIDCHR